VALALRSTGAVVSSSTVNTIEVTPPGTIVDGDQVRIFAYFDDDQTISCPESGFTKEDEIQSITGGDMAVATFYKTASSESGNYTVNFGGPAGNARCVAVAVSGIDTGTPVDAASTSSEDTADQDTYDPPAITTVTANAWVWSLMGANQSAGTGLTQPSGYTLVAEGNSSDNFGVAYIDAGATGVEDPGNWSGIGSSADSAGITIAMRPAGAAAASPKNPLGHPLYGPLQGPIS